MFQNITQSYTLSDASGEIFIMLVVSMVLGMMLGWLLKPVNNNKHQEDGKEIRWTTAAKQDDDLQMIEGVGPAIEKLLNKHWVMSFHDIIQCDVSGLEDILEIGWSRFKMHIPTTWPDQAVLADSEKWSELEEYQDILNAGNNKKV
mgnify:CR=1 FL=1